MDNGDWFFLLFYGSRKRQQTKKKQQKIWPLFIHLTEQAWPIREYIARKLYILYIARKLLFIVIMWEIPSSQDWGPSNSLRWLIRTRNLLHFPSHVTCHKINDRSLLLMKLSYSLKRVHVCSLKVVWAQDLHLIMLINHRERCFCFVLIIVHLFCFHCCSSVVPSQVYALVGSEKKGQVLGGMVAAGAGKFLLILIFQFDFHVTR